MRSARSYTVTRWPAWFSCAAAASPAGPEPMTATRLPVRFAGGSGDDPAFLEASVDDRHLDVLDRDRGIGDAEHARAFARRRAHASGELGEVVGLVQPIQRFAPVAAIHQIVPFRNQVVDRAAVGRLTERHAAIHAARPLRCQVLRVVSGVDLLEIEQPLRRVAVRLGLAREFLEPRGFAHICFLLMLRQRTATARRLCVPGERACSRSASL